VRVEALREMASNQHGVVLTADLRRLGIPRTRERALLEQGWLVEILRGAYLLGSSRPSDWQLLVAAWRLAGPGAVVSHSSAGRIHRIYGVVPPRRAPEERGQGVVELTIIRPSHRRPPGCLVHRYAQLPAEHITTHRGVKVTTPARTLIDLTPVLPPAVLEKAVDEGAIARLWTPQGLMAVVERSPGRQGIDTLRRILAARTGQGRTDSPLENRVVRALASFGPFETQYQVVIDQQVYVLDLAWPRFLVAVECEGWEVRARSRGKFDHDRRRANLLTSHGWTLVRLTAAMSDDEMRAAVFRVLLRAAADG